MQPTAIEMLDHWIKKQREPHTRPEVIRRLVERELKVKK